MSAFFSGYLLLDGHVQPPTKNQFSVLSIMTAIGMKIYTVREHHRVAANEITLFRKKVLDAWTIQQRQATVS